MTDVSSILKSIDECIRDNDENPQYPRWAIYYYNNDDYICDDDEYWIMDGNTKTSEKVFERCWYIVKGIDESYLQYNRIVLVKQHERFSCDELYDIWNKERDEDKIDK